MQRWCFIFILILGCWVSHVQACTLEWDPVTTRVDGSLLTNLGGYTLYYSTDQITWSPILLAIAPTSLTATFSCAIGYYTVTAFDTDSNESDQSNIVEVTSPDHVKVRIRYLGPKKGSYLVPIESLTCY